MKILLLKYIDAFLIFLIAFIFYYVQLPPGITFEDAGYFIATSLGGGYAHPPGYPLYTLLLKVWALAGGLFTNNAAYLGSLLSAVLISTSLAFLYIFLNKHISDKAFSSLKIKRGLIILLCLLMMSSFELIEQTLLIEVYALHFILLIILFLSLNQQKYIITGLTTGLALSNHSTAIYFFAFTLLWLIFINPTPIKEISSKGLKQFFPGLLAGLLPYLYLPIVANPLSPLQWGTANTWAGFKEIVFRTNYWKVPASELSTQLKQLQIAGVHFIEQWGFIIPIVFLFSFAIYIISKNGNKKSLYWHLCWLIQLPIMAVLANMSTEAEGTKLVSVFFIPAYLFALISIGVAYEQFSLIKTKLDKTKLEYGLIGLLSLSFVYSISTNYNRNNLSNYNTPLLYTQQVRDLVKNDKAILLTWNDFAFTPIVYEKHVLGKFEKLIPIPHSFFKDYNMILKYEKMYKLEVTPLKEASVKFLQTRQQGFIGTINDDDFYQALAKNISIWLNQGYRVFTEYKLNSESAKKLYFDPSGPFFEVLRSKPLLEKRFSFLDLKTPNYKNGNNDLWHKQFYAKYSEQLILKALLNRSSKSKDKYLQRAKSFSTDTLVESKVHEGIKKHFPDFK